MENIDLSPALNKGTTRAIFSSTGTIPEVIDRLKIWVKGLLIEIIVSLIKLMGTLSKPMAVPECKERHKLITSCSEISSNLENSPNFQKEKNNKTFEIQEYYVLDWSQFW